MSGKKTASVSSGAGLSVPRGSVSLPEQISALVTEAPAAELEALGERGIRVLTV